MFLHDNLSPFNTPLLFSFLVNLSCLDDHSSFSLGQCSIGYSTVPLYQSLFILLFLFSVLELIVLSCLLKWGQILPYEYPFMDSSWFSKFPRVYTYFVYKWSVMSRSRVPVVQHITAMDSLSTMQNNKKILQLRALPHATTIDTHQPSYAVIYLQINENHLTTKF